jgi:hypothetical protein
VLECIGESIEIGAGHAKRSAGVPPTSDSAFDLG